MLPNDRNDNEQPGIRMVHPGSRQLFRYWEALRAERACPTRAEIDLAMISNLLPNITVLEETEVQGWRHRMAGTAVCELLHEQVTWGDAVSGFDRSARDTLLRIFGIAVKQAQPAIMRMRLIGQHYVIPAEMLALPVLDTRKNNSQLFCGLFGFNTELAISGASLLRRELVSARLILTEHSSGADNLRFRGSTQLQVIQGGLSNSSQVQANR